MRPEVMSDSPEREHLTGEQIVDLLYGDPAASDEHVRSCGACKAEVEAYRSTLSQLHEWRVPERGPNYGSAVWNRISPRLPGRRRRFRISVPVLAWGSVAAAGLVLFVGLLVHRNTAAPDTALPAPRSEQSIADVSGSERLLSTAVRDHLERTSVLLTEVENVTGVENVKERSWQGESLDDLIAENRLYRETAEQEQEHGTAALLGEVESILVDLQHVSGRHTAAELDGVRQRISNSDLRFKLRVFDSRMEPRLVRTAGAKL